jgi:predicted DNA-binding ribbon-helix-helix protein
LAGVGSGGEHGADAANRGAVAVSVPPRNAWVDGRYTTLRLEPIFWEGLSDIAASRGTTVHEVITEVDRTRRGATLASAVRVRVLRCYRDIVEGREAAGDALYRGEERR